MKRRRRGKERDITFEKGRDRDAGLQIRDSHNDEKKWQGKGGGGKGAVTVTVTVEGARTIKAADTLPPGTRSYLQAPNGPSLCTCYTLYSPLFPSNC